jgi:hypothetical protein
MPRTKIQFLFLSKSIIYSSPISISPYIRSRPNQKKKKNQINLHEDRPIRRITGHCIPPEYNLQHIPKNA